MKILLTLLIVLCTTIPAAALTGSEPELRGGIRLGRNSGYCHAYCHN